MLRACNLLKKKKGINEVVGLRETLTNNSGIIDLRRNMAVVPHQAECTPLR